MKKKSIFLVLGITILLTGCASYQSNSLSALDPQCVRKYEEAGDMSIGVKAYSKDDCYTFLDRDVISKGYQPIQLTFQNSSDKHYLFSVNEVSLPCVNPEEVANTVHTSTVGRVVGYSVGGLLFWPLFIPAVVDGIKSSNANQALDRDYYDKAKEHLVITPNSFVKTLIFVPRSHFAPVFDITLLEEETRETKKISLSVAQ